MLRIRSPTSLLQTAYQGRFALLLCKFFNRIRHFLFPSLCVDCAQKTGWRGSHLRCPECGRLIAYSYTLHHQPGVYVCYRYRKYAPGVCFSHISAPDSFDAYPEAFLQWDLPSQADEPLLSDSWDDDIAYQQCVDQYIAQYRSYNKNDQE